MTESGPGLHRVPRKGALLVASPRLLDPNFMHTVVLLCEHAAEGTFGLIVNRPLPLKVGDLDSDVGLLQGRADRLWSGGPVARGELQVIHDGLGEVPGAMPVVDGVRFGGDPAVLRSALEKTPEAPVKFVVGYAGWGAGQLDAEMTESSWIVVRATARRILDPEPETLWRRVLRAEGGEVAELADVPPDPSWN
jgi:putative transcriptional regulator